MLRRELEGVGEEVVQHLLDAEIIPQQGGALRLELLPQGLALSLRLDAEGAKALLHAFP